MSDFFMDLDNHKKGFLNEKDWKIAFSGYNWVDQMIEEIKDSLSNCFENIQDGFEFFKKQSKLQLLDQRTFNVGLNLLFPKRFIEEDIKKMWNVLSSNQKIVDFNRFVKVFAKNKPNFVDNTQEDQQIRPKTVEGFFCPPALQLNMQIKGKSAVSEFNLKTVGSRKKSAPSVVNQENLLDKIRRFLRSSNKSVKLILENADTNKIGKLTNLEFKNALKMLNLGLSNQEIQELINICGVEGFLDIKEFLHFFDLRETDFRILERSRLKLRHITNLIYSYMLSPKDAFRQFDKENKGFITKEQFENFILTLCRLALEEVPPHTIILDLFNYIDQKMDNKIDQEEWMDIFSQFDYIPQAQVLRQTQPQPLTVSNLEKKKFLQNSFISEQNPLSRLQSPLSIKSSIQIKSLSRLEPPTKDIAASQFFQRPSTQQNNTARKQYFKQIFDWEGSKEFDQVLVSIARNRKFLIETFSALNQTGVPITYEIAKTTIQKMLRLTGLQVKEESWPSLIKFAEKDGLVNYKFLLDVYRDRGKMIDCHPKMWKNIF